MRSQLHSLSGNWYRRDLTKHPPGSLKCRDDEGLTQECRALPCTHVPEFLKTTSSLQAHSVSLPLGQFWSDSLRDRLGQRLCQRPRKMLHAAIPRNSGLGTAKARSRNLVWQLLPGELPDWHNNMADHCNKSGGSNGLRLRFLCCCHTCLRSSICSNHT